MKFILKSLAVAFVFSRFLVVHAAYDADSVRNSWLNWTNTERTKAGSENLVINEILNSTSLDWSTYSKTRGNIDHKRPKQKTYYDFNRITKWFSDKGVTFKKINSVTFSESIGWNTYSCREEDCTIQITKAVRKTFDFYMREKGKKYGPHYKAMIKPEFSQIGVGLVLDEKKKRYYITIHYGTEVFKEE